jgi:hypothetical protein
MPVKPRPAALRFWEKVNPDDDCWIWTGSRDRKGYGSFRGADGQTILAHRMAWLLEYGQIADELCVLHACDAPSCVRPDHLFLGTVAENNRDMAAKGRHATRTSLEHLRRGANHPRRLHPETVLRGERHPMARLTALDVEAMRREHESGKSGAEIGRRYGVSPGHARKVVKGEAWA